MFILRQGNVNMLTSLLRKRYKILTHPDKVIKVPGQGKDNILTRFRQHLNKVQTMDEQSYNNTRIML